MSYHVSDEIPEAIDTDGSWAFMILLNFVSNAFKSTQHGSNPSPSPSPSPKNPHPSPNPTLTLITRARARALILTLSRSTQYGSVSISARLAGGEG